MRPPITEDIENLASDGDFEDCVRLGPDGRSLAISKWSYDEREFRFDTVLPPHAAQMDMYDAVGRDIVKV